MFLRLFILLLIQTFPSGNDPPLFNNSIKLSLKKVIIVGEDRKGPYKLPDIFILKNSEIAIKDTITLERERDYFLNTKTGTILFFESLKKEDKVTISYHYFPFTIKKEYKRRSIGSFMQGKPVLKEEKIRKDTTKKYEKTGITIGGAKTFSIGMNSYGGFSFDQSLRVNITGEITKGLSISGVLSDENTPLEPEGTTESLEELDRIYVTVKGRGIGATLGDYILHYKTPTTPVIQRDLLGVTGNIKRGGTDVNVAYGIPRGKFHSLHIKGIEGKQGPYQLTSPEGEEDIVIVSRTETVYLDGFLMKRGEKNDYIIDYSLAQLIFTSKRLITEESDIVVEFQYTKIGFRRSLYSTRVDYKKSNYNVGCFFIRDGDEITQTEGFELTKERKAFLASIGDDTTMNWMGSGVYVGEGKGDYSFSDSFYVYRGYREGEWNVSFTYVGDGKGDYVYSDTLSGFVYVGYSSGDYVSKIRCPLPDRVYTTGFDIGFNDGKNLKLQGELFGSDYDRNILSSIDDNDNKGYLTDLNGNLNLVKSKWGDMNILGGYRYRNKNFEPPSRMEKKDFEERWNIRSSTGMEEIKNGGIVYSKENLFLSKANVSSLKRENSKATLREGVFYLRRKNLPNVDITSSTVSIHGDTLLRSVKKTDVTIAYSVWRILPKIFATQELRNESRRKRWREGGGELGFLLLKNSKLVFGYNKRSDEIYNRNEEGYERESRTITKKLVFETEETNIFKGSLNVTSRERRFTPHFPGENTELLFIEFATHSVSFMRRLDIETNYSVTGKNSVVFKEIFYEVKEGTGDYSKDPTTGQYYPDTLGNYKRKIDRIGEGNPVTALKTYIRVGITPAKIIRCNLTASITEENKGSEKMPIYTLRLKRFLNDSLTVKGRQTLDGNISLYLLKSTSFSYSLNFLKGLNNELVTRAKRDYSDRNEFRIEQRLTEKSKISLEYSRKRRIEERVEGGLEKSERKEEFSPEYSHYLLDNFEVRIKAKTGNVKIEEPLWYSQLGVINIKTEGISPSLDYTIKNSAIIDACFTVTRNSIPIHEDDLPYDVKSFYPVGITTDWKIGTNISISSMFSMNISYNGLNRPDKKTMHSANAELRADF
ncbi:MAG: hypothetical protein E3J41_07935 [Candidatus Cloacimonadota bacterium]|nr:MAG: hypothetical protein E3J41_07935 [Candidatus Cloacimonadota bacterium]